METKPLQEKSNPGNACLIAILVASLLFAGLLGNLFYVFRGQFLIDVSRAKPLVGHSAIEVQKTLGEPRWISTPSNPSRLQKYRGGWHPTPPEQGAYDVWIYYYGSPTILIYIRPDGVVEKVVTADS